LTVNAGENMESELLWALDDDVFACRVPANHVMVLGAFEEAGERKGNLVKE